MKASALASEKSVKCATVCPISAFLPKLQEFSIRACCDLTVISCGIVSRVYETRPGDTLRLIAGQQLGRRPATGLILAIDEGIACLLASRTMKHGAVSSTDHCGGKRRGWTLAGLC